MQLESSDLGTSIVLPKILIKRLHLEGGEGIVYGVDQQNHTFYDHSVSPKLGYIRGIAVSASTQKSIE